MTTSSRNANNNFKQMGWTDRDYIDKYNLDPSLEGNPKINEAIAHAIRKENEAWYLKQGDKPEEAKAKADSKFSQAMRDMKK